MLKWKQDFEAKEKRDIGGRSLRKYKEKVKSTAWGLSLGRRKGKMSLTTYGLDDIISKYLK